MTTEACCLDRNFPTAKTISKCKSSQLAGQTITVGYINYQRKDLFRVSESRLLNALYVLCL